MAKKGDHISSAIGRRKNSVARVYLSERKEGEGKGEIVVNHKSYEEYFGRETSRMVVRQPLEALEALEKYDIAINVSGGGHSGQAGAIRHGISRALEIAQEGARAVLKPKGFLTRDAREVERKKYGRHKARKSTQFSKR